MEKILIFIKLNIYKIPVFKNLMDSDMLFKKKHFVCCYGLNCVSYRILKSQLTTLVNVTLFGNRFLC